MAVVKFAQLQSCVDMSFWSELGERKLNEYKLSDAAVPIRGWFGPSRYVQLPGQLQLDASSFPPATTASASLGEPSGAASVQANPLHHDLPKPGLHGVPGTLTNFNTLDAFRAADKQQLLQQAASQLWSDLLSGAAEQDPALLARFSLITFADLKSFKFTYWFMFPVLKPPAPFTCEKASTLQAALGEAASLRVCAACDAWRGLALGAMGLEGDSPAPVGHPAWLLAASDPELSDLQSMHLSSWESVHSPAGQHPSRVFLAVPDPSNLEGHPGWTLRNVLLMAAVRWGARQIQVVCCRDLRGRTDPNRSQLIDITLPQIPSGWCQGDKGAPDCVGWEPNAEGRLQAREVDLSAHMSPHHLAEQAVDLNLHLMRWRAVPELDTQRVADAKCLLLGAGTLGCAVARTLLAWGVRHITFLDSSRVSFSNPVRQSLYDFNDCVEGGKPKAQAAADALQRIFPSVRSTGVALSIPMPGHLPSTPAQLEAARQATAQLDELVASHDAVFLLTDTRESRWLPSLLAAAHDRVAITSAVGFDSFLVMRHGAAPSRPLPHPACARLGCYFCNDVVAPLNSTKDRTLDQQCTVARPGLAPIAGAVAVELLVALLQHPLRQSAPTPSWKPPPVAPGSQQAAGVMAEGVLGSVPHMVRGQLNGFQQTCMEGAAFSQCTACSPTVVDRYKSQGWDFILEALKDPRSLEDLTGLTALHQQAMDMLNCDDSDEEGERQEGTGTQPAGDVPGAGAASGSVPGDAQDLEDWDTL